MPKITGDMIIADVLRMDRGTAPIFLNMGLHCLGCPSSTGETIEEACAVHGMEVEVMLKELNDYFASKEA